MLPMRSFSCRPDRVREADAQDAAQLLNWLGMVVHPEVNQSGHCGHETLDLPPRPLVLPLAGHAGRHQRFGLRLAP